MIPDIINKIDCLINKKIDKCDKKQNIKLENSKKMDLDIDEDDIDEEYYEEDKK